MYVKRFITVVFVAALLAGCFTTKANKDVDSLRAQYCAGGESVIIDTIGDPVTANILLQSANCALLQYDVYSVQKANAIIDAAITYLSDSGSVITGADVFAFMYKHVEELRKELGVIQPIIILSALAPQINVPDVLTECDRALLLKHLEIQKMIIEQCAVISAE